MSRFWKGWTAAAYPVVNPYLQAPLKSAARTPEVINKGDKRRWMLLGNAVWDVRGCVDDVRG
eukprot:2125411-Pyramimonas_sp.AAC.1